jgi:proline racemase
MVDRKKYFQKNFDHIRTTLTLEPRYFPGVVAVLVPPSNSEADYGVIFSDYRGYPDMCVHGTMGIVTSLFELGLLKDPRKPLTFDTASGLVRARANLRRGRIKSVSVSNVPSFYIEKVILPGGVEAEIAFGGNTYAYLESSFKIVPENLGKLLALGKDVLQKLSASKYRKFKVLGVSLYEDLGESKARNIMIADEGLFDRSPCGTGTCGRMAMLFKLGKLKMNQKFFNRSIIGSEFIGRIIRRRKIGEYEAIDPEITGTAYLTGRAEMIVSEADKLGEGFSVGNR